MLEEVTVTEAMKLSKFSRCHIYNLINGNKIVARKINTRAAPIILIARASLEAYMLERERTVDGEKSINR